MADAREVIARETFECTESDKENAVLFADWLITALEREGLAIVPVEVAKHALRRISQLPSDTKLPPMVESEVPILCRLGWLRSIDSTDGAYVEVTDLGKEVLRASQSGDADGR